ncbi:hypothetical protein BS78_10G114000 [Paspalum vaginatum]|nr:hypothetical protein BS78_10G114000 [Paspalum vaginatum]
MVYIYDTPGYLLYWSEPVSHNPRQKAKMKATGCRAGGNAAAAKILIAVLLGCLAASSQCARVPTPTDLAAGGRGADAAVAAAGDHLPEPFCYKACGNGRCDFCCASEYTPTFCWSTETKCKQECHPPLRRAAYPH